MSESRMSWTEILVPTSFLLALGLYVGSYLFLMEPTILLREVDFGNGYQSTMEADYAYGGEWAQHAYAPLEWLDHKLFPARWNAEVEIQ